VLRRARAASMAADVAATLEQQTLRPASASAESDAGSDEEDAAADEDEDEDEEDDDKGAHVYPTLQKLVAPGARFFNALLDMYVRREAGFI
jgi:hypothetical protein